MSAVTITTRYKPRPGSNVGAFVATGAGRQRSVVDQSIADPHRAAAAKLAEVLDLVVVEEADATDDGQRRRWKTKEPEIFLLMPGATEPEPYSIPDDEAWVATLAEGWKDTIYFFEGSR